MDDERQIGPILLNSHMIYNIRDFVANDRKVSIRKMGEASHNEKKKFNSFLARL